MEPVVVDSLAGLGSGIPLPTGTAPWGRPFDRLDLRGTSSGEFVTWDGRVFGMTARLRLPGRSDGAVRQYAVEFPDVSADEPGFARVLSSAEDRCGPGFEGGSTRGARRSWKFGSLIMQLFIDDPGEFSGGFDVVCLQVEKRASLTRWKTVAASGRTDPVIMVRAAGSHRFAGGSVVAEVVAMADGAGFDKLVDFVERHYGAEVVERIDRPGDRQWLIDVGGDCVELWHEDDVGNTLVATTRKSDGLVETIAEDLMERLSTDSARAALASSGWRAAEAALDAPREQPFLSHRDRRAKRRAALVSAGSLAARKKPSDDLQLSSATELEAYLVARGGKLARFVVEFWPDGRERAASQVRWDAAAATVRVERGSREVEVSLDGDGQLSTQAFERALASVAGDQR